LGATPCVGTWQCFGSWSEVRFIIKIELKNLNTGSVYSKEIFNDFCRTACWKEYDTSAFGSLYFTKINGNNYQYNVYLHALSGADRASADGVITGTVWYTKLA
jgi:hypothetical protein